MAMIQIDKTNINNLAYDVSSSINKIISTCLLTGYTKCKFGLANWQSRPASQELTACLFINFFKEKKMRLFFSRINELTKTPNKPLLKEYDMSLTKR